MLASINVSRQQCTVLVCTLVFQTMDRFDDPKGKQIYVPQASD